MLPLTIKFSLLYFLSLFMITSKEFEYLPKTFIWAFTYKPISFNMHYILRTTLVLRPVENEDLGMVCGFPSICGKSTPRAQNMIYSSFLAAFLACLPCHVASSHEL